MFAFSLLHIVKGGSWKDWDIGLFCISYDEFRQSRALLRVSTCEDNIEFDFCYFRLK